METRMARNTPGGAVEDVAVRAGCNVFSYGSESEARQRLQELGTRAAAKAAATNATDAAVSSAVKEAHAFWADHVYVLTLLTCFVTDDCGSAFSVLCAVTIRPVAWSL
jgi:hypothetical protein